MALVDPLNLPVSAGAAITIGGVVDGFEAFAIADLCRQRGESGPVLYIARDGQRLGTIASALRFVAPDLPALELPAWDCLPYDRVSPGMDAASRRLYALSRIAALNSKRHPAIILTSANAVLQRMPPQEIIARHSISARPGNRIDMTDFARLLEDRGFERTSTVRDVGEYAVRGGIIDIFPPGADEPLRLDFFGDTLESVRSFDPATQRTTGQREALDLEMMSEVVLNEETISRFRRNYIEEFGAPSPDDSLYHAISEGRRFAGMEHWLALFYERMDTIFDYLPDAPVIFDHLAHEALQERSEQIDEHYEARAAQLSGKSLGQSAPYKPLRPGLMYLSASEIDEASHSVARFDLTPFHADPEHGPVVQAYAHRTRTFAAERSDPKINVFEAVIAHVNELKNAGKRVVIAGWSAGSLERLGHILDEHHVGKTAEVSSLGQAEKLEFGITALAVLPLETGFETTRLAIIGEQDILGDRLVRQSTRRKRAADFISEASLLSPGDIVVHADHGIGRFVGLKTIEAAGAPHDCAELHYAGDDRLFLPVENIELLSRYGSDEAAAVLDRLGGAAWQARKARLKKRLLEMAGELIRTAAERAMRNAPKLLSPQGLTGEFAARFPYEETDDQMNAIEAVTEDLGAGTPMDRLICGDVGFGKTEVALRAAFIAAMDGMQVAVVVPTTLLARQHFKTFSERFAGLPVNIAQASRMVGARSLEETKKGISNGSVDIVIGTHALFGKAIEFKNLGLLIIDEEQHFGVKHKERLKQLKNNVHVLTLSATPIPRTLQLALTGVRELSLIATPPVDRLAVRTFVSPFDALVIRQTLLRERYRGGQSFYVVPRIADLPEVKSFLDEQVPELKVAVAHGRMTPHELDDVMNAFYDGKYDVLLSTTIIESGLDIPTANTLVVHRADMFGLAQLYQIRGRVGRSKLRAYALFTLPVNKKLTRTAERRLKVLQSLDTLGAGFQLASHDLDIRGAGNLLGEEQSGHIKEVGYELYQQMLEEAVAEIRGGEAAAETGWSPQISLGTSVMIPESYVPDLQVRLLLYRRLGDLQSAGEIDGFGAELIDRFGPMPDEVDHLLKVVYIKALCRQANIEKLDAGPKGVVIQFRDQQFANPVGLVRMIGEQGVLAKIRPDQSVFFARDWPNADRRLAGAATIATQLARLAVQEAA
jgi:transcription-repair coupling factor (superfamily II helicase)